MNRFPFYLDNLVRILAKNVLVCNGFLITRLSRNRQSFIQETSLHAILPHLQIFKDQKIKKYELAE